MPWKINYRHRLTQINTDEKAKLINTVKNSSPNPPKEKIRVICVLNRRKLYFIYNKITKIVAGMDDETTETLVELYGLITNVYKAKDINKDCRSCKSY